MLNKAFYSILLRNTLQIVTVFIGVSTPHPPKKHHPLILAKLTPIKSANCPSHLFKESPLYIDFSWTFPKSGIFQWTPKFFILNTILTKFFVEICQFEFLVMTEQIIFVHKLFLPLNI